MRRYYPIKELFLARMREFFREPETVFWAYFFPLLLMGGLGIAFTNSDDPEVRVRVSATSAAQAAELAKTLQVLGGFRVTPVALTAIDPDAPQTQWDITVMGRGAKIEYLYDPTMPESRVAYSRVNQALQQAAGRTDPLETEVRHISVPGSRYIDWVIPGLMGLNIMGGGIWGVGFVAVDMRIRKLLKRFQATPMRNSDFLFSLMAGRLLFLGPEMALILLGGYLLFGTKVQGNVFTLAVVGAIGAVAFAGLGLLVSCRAQKLETISGLMNVVMLPMWILSGVFFSADRFPEAMQPFVQALPLTQLNHALRGVVLHGHGIFEEWLALTILAAWGLVCFPLALRWFRWQ